MNRNMSVNHIQSKASGVAAQKVGNTGQNFVPNPFQSVRASAIPGDKSMIFQKQFSRETGFRIDPKFLSFIIAFATLLTLLLAAAPSVQAQGSGCRYWDGRWTFRMSGNYINGKHALFNNTNCTPPATGSINFGSTGVADASTAEAAIRICKRHTGASSMSVSRFGLYWSCNPKSGGGGGGSGSGSSSGDGADDNAWYRRAEIQVSKLPLGSIMVKAELGLNSGIQFERYDHYAVGVQAVVDRGIRDVVDVWGQASQNFEVCFPQDGAIVFIDASTLPRSLVEISSFVRDGYTCGAMNRAGTMVLVKGSSSSQSNNTLAQEFIDATTDPVTSAIALEDCSVSSSHHLNLRQEPWGAKITVVPKHTSVQAIARTESWYQVRFTEAEIEEDEADSSSEAFEGWMSAWLSEGGGDCEWQSDDGASPALASSEVTPQDEELSIASLDRYLGI